MDSNLAVDAAARAILENLAILERAAGVRSHYRFIDPPPLTGTDLVSLQTAARVLGDCVGLRNSFFHIASETLGSLPAVTHSRQDQEEFTIDMPQRAFTGIAPALATLARGVAQAYLIKSNIGNSNVVMETSPGVVNDVTAHFLGLGKLLLNDGQPARPGQTQDLAQPLSMYYQAFTHRATCAMRGLDYSQHFDEMHHSAIEAVKAWDIHRETIFSLGLRNVLASTATQKPVLDGIEDNQVVLARFDQLRRLLETALLTPLEGELTTYHLECRQALDRLHHAEPETYDPCLVYLNQIRRRMDLQRFADALSHQKHIVLDRLEVLACALRDLDKRHLLHCQTAKEAMANTRCPFDQTLMTAAHETRHGLRKCSKCGYEMLVSPEIPYIVGVEETAPGGSVQKPEENVEEAAAPITTLSGEKGRDTVSKKYRSLKLMLFAMVVLALSWLPLLGYVGYCLVKRIPPPFIHADMLSRVGLYGSAAAGALIVISLLMLLVGALRTRNR